MAEPQLVGNGESYFWVRGGTCDEEVLRARYARNRFFASRHQLRPNDVVVDLGAHIGAFAIAAAQAVPLGHVYAVEPARASFALLTRNLAINNLTNASAYRCAVSARTGTATLYRGADSWADNLICAQVGRSSETVDTTTLEDFLECHDIADVDYLKMNVEGAEYSILLDTPKRVLRRIRCMLIEHHPTVGCRPEQLIKRLDQCGFDVRHRSTAGEPGKGWLTATC
jgi:FkbM family methyltransferase